MKKVDKGSTSGTGDDEKKKVFPLSLRFKATDDQGFFLEAPPPKPSKELRNSVQAHGTDVWTVSVNTADYGDPGQIESLRFATASQDGTVRVWRGAESATRGTLSDHGSPVFGVSYSPCGKILATTSHDNTIRLWLQLEIPELPGEDEPPLSKAENVRRIRLERSGGWTSRRVIEGHTNSVNCVRWNKAGDLLLTASNDNTVRLWTLDGKCRQVYKGHTDDVRDCDFSPCGRVIVTASWDKTVRLWGLRSGREIKILVGHKDYVWTVAYSPPGDYIASGSWDNTVRIWDRSGKPVAAMMHNDRVTCVRFVPQGDLLGSASVDKVIKVWTLTGKCIVKLNGHLAGINAFAFSPCGEAIVSGDEDGVVKVWKLDLPKDKEEPEEKLSEHAWRPPTVDTALANAENPA